MRNDYMKAALAIAVMSVLATTASAQAPQGQPRPQANRPALAQQQQVPQPQGPSFSGTVSVVPGNTLNMSAEPAQGQEEVIPLTPEQAAEFAQRHPAQPQPQGPVIFNSPVPAQDPRPMRSAAPTPQPANPAAQAPGGATQAANKQRALQMLDEALRLLRAE